MIEFKKVSVSFDQKTVLKGFSSALPERGLVLLTGPSGSGKTTLLRLILGLIKPDSGEVVLSEKVKKVSVVFQEDRLVPSLSALENVALVTTTAEAEKRLSEVGLAEAKDLCPAELSGGMKRRVAIARALAFSGEVLILDEAFTGIEEALCREILAKITAEYKDRLIIAVTHRPSLFKDYDYMEMKI